MFAVFFAIFLQCIMVSILCMHFQYCIYISNINPLPSVNADNRLKRTLLGEGKDWLAQCQEHVTELDIRSWCWWPDFLVGQHYKFTMCAYCQQSLLILILP